MPEIDLKQALKASHWEQAKGHLQAMVAIEGSVFSGQLASAGPMKFEVLQEHISDFVKFIEREEYHL